MTNRTVMSVFAVVMAWTGLCPAPADAQAPVPVVEYYHVDAVGSVRAVTNQSGGLVRRHDYFPFGDGGDGVAAGTDPLRFSGKEREAETGLDYFGARYYAQRGGRFTTVDPVLDIEQALVGPQRWNRYAYVLNGPYRYVDPDGANPVRIAQIIGQWAQGLPGVQRAQQVVASQGSRAWIALNRLFNTTQGQEVVRAVAEVTTGAEAGPIGFAPGLGQTALTSSRLQHASRHLTAAGLLPNWSKETGQAFVKLASNILEHPTQTFDHALGGVAVKGFVGAVDGKTVVVFVFSEGRYAGEVATSLVPSPKQAAAWGIQK